MIRCDGCRHWYLLGYPGRGGCDRLPVMVGVGQHDQPPAGVYLKFNCLDASKEWVVLTSPDFGCIHGEPK